MMLRIVAIFTVLLGALALFCTAAGAQAWVKYQHTSTKPAFTIEFPSGWTVNTTKKAEDYTLGQLVFPGKFQVSFETKADTDLLECGVKVYGIPGNVSGADMLIAVTAVGSGSAGMTVSQLHGQDYLKKTDTPTVDTQKRTIWRSFFLGEKNFYMVYLDVPASFAKQQPACQQAYASMIRSFTAPDWPLKTASANAQDPVQITVVNASSKHSLYIEINQTGNANKRSVNAGQQWTVTLTKGPATGFTGFFGRGGNMVPNTMTEPFSDTIDKSATWTFSEGQVANAAKSIKWVRQVSKAPSSADALGTWLKYVHADPKFAQDMPGGWTVIGGDKPDKIASAKFTLTPQGKVSFAYGVKPNDLCAGVSVYTASETADVPKLQALLAAQKVDEVTAPPLRTVKQLNGHDYLLEESTTTTTFTWNSYLPIDTTVYLLSFTGPIASLTPSKACYKQMAESFLTNSWQPIQPPAVTKPATAPAPTAKTATGSGK